MRTTYFNAEKVQQWLTKKNKAIVQQVDEDSEVVEVVLIEGYANSTHLETVWVFGKDRYESGDYTLKQIRADLSDWLSKVKPEHELV